MNLTTEKRYSAANGYPGEQIGMNLNQAKDAYRLSRKVFGQQVNLQSGRKPRNRYKFTKGRSPIIRFINLPKL
jgi:hypothetical protein